MNLLERRRAMISALAKSQSLVFLEYIQSSGTQYIDTGIYSKSGLTIEYAFQIIGERSISVALFGGREASTLNQLVCFMNTDRHIGIRFNDSPSAYGPRITIDDKKHVVKFVDNESYVDGEYNSRSMSSQPFLGNCTIFVFGVNTGGDFDTLQVIGQRAYSFKIKDGNSLVRNFIPCYRKSDNVAGMYDLVTNTFYTNAGTGDFIVGPDLN